MEELVEIMQDVLIELKNINSKLDKIKGNGRYYSPTDIHDKLREIIQSVDAVSSTIVHKQL